MPSFAVIFVQTIFCRDCVSGYKHLADDNIPSIKGIVTAIALLYQYQISSFSGTFSLFIVPMIAVAKSAGE